MTSTRSATFDLPTWIDTGLGSLSRTGMDRLPADTIEPLGSVINGRYRVEEVLGRGGMGVVYRISDQLFPERRLALKTIAGHTVDTSRLSLFKAEFKILAELSHPNVAQVYDFEALKREHETDRVDDEFFFTMAFVDGNDCFTSTDGKSWREITSLMVQVLRGLAYVHSRRLIHFDIKPHNVLVDREGVAKIVDFGLAGARSEDKATRGTPAYIAPEVILHEPVDHRADLYSFGIMFYQLLFRRLPFASASMLEVLEQHVTQPVSFTASDDVPEWLHAIVKRLCEKDPTKRFRSANAVIEAFAQGSGSIYDIETKDTKESYILSSSFVGRAAELERLMVFFEARTEEKRANGAVAMLVAGPGGIGKSRLMREVRQRIQLARCMFVEGNCFENDPAEFGPIAEVIRHLAAIAEAIGAWDMVEAHGAALARLDPDFDKFASLRRQAAVDAAPKGRGKDRDELLVGVAKFLTDLSLRLPYAVYFNDLQWAGPGTSDAIAVLVANLRQLASEGRSPRLALFGSYRNDEIAGRPFARWLDEISGTGVMDVLELAPLEKSSVNELLASMLGLDNVPAAFGATVARDSGGNPLFVEEVMKALLDHGAIFLERGRWATSQKIEEIDIPTSIGNALDRRLALVSPLARTALDVIAAYTRPIPMEVIDEVCPIDRASVGEAVSELIRRGMVHEIRGGREPLYQATHDRLRETVYEQLGTERQRRLHLQFGQALERLYSDALEAHVYELAHHFWRANEHEKAFAYARLGAKKAQESYAVALAIELYRRALDLFPAGGRADDRRHMLEAVADLEQLNGEWEASVARYQELLAQENEVLKGARLQRKLGEALIQKGELRKGLTCMNRAVALLGGDGRVDALGLTLGILRAAVVHIAYRNMPRTIRRAKDDEEKQKLIEMSATLERMTCPYGWVNPLVSVRSVLDAFNAAERSGDAATRAAAYSNASLYYAVFGKNESAKMLLDEAIRIGREMGSPAHIGIGLMMTGHLSMMRGAHAEAIAPLSDAIAQLERCGFRYELARSYVLLSLCHFEFGDFRTLKRVSNERLAELTDNESYLWAKELMCLSGIAEIMLGDSETGHVHIQKAIRLSEMYDNPANLCIAELYRAFAHQIEDDNDLALASLERALKIFDDGGLNDDDRHTWLSVLLARAMAKRYGYISAELKSSERNRRKKVILASLKKGGRKGEGSPLRSQWLLSRALFRWHTGDREAAERDFQESIAVAERQQKHYFYADACFEYASCLSAVAQLDKARPFVERALTVAKKCEARPLIVRAARLRASLVGEQPPLAGMLASGGGSGAGRNTLGEEALSKSEPSAAKSSP